MIILRQKNYSRFDLTPEEQEVWKESTKHEKPNLKELIQQAKKYGKHEHSKKELRDMGIKTGELRKGKLDSVSLKNPKLWGDHTGVERGDHFDVVRSRIAKKKLGKISTGVGIGLGTAAILTAGGIALHKHNKKKRKEEENKDADTKE